MNNLWISNPDYVYKPSRRDTRKKHEKKAYTVRTNHPIYLQLRKEYGLDAKKRKFIGEEEHEDNDDDSEYDDEE